MYLSLQDIERLRDLALSHGIDIIQVQDMRKPEGGRRVGRSRFKMYSFAVNLTCYPDFSVRN
ncbi:hypothetical protein LC609_14710 [Nostoc sp. XA013]|nr:hypothetical protein [Nostoc sp. XA013]